MSGGASPTPVTFLKGALRKTAGSVPIGDAARIGGKALSGGAVKSVESAGPSAAPEASRAGSPERAKRRVPQTMFIRLGRALRPLWRTVALSHSALPFGPERLDLVSSTGLTAERLMALPQTLPKTLSLVEGSPVEQPMADACTAREMVLTH